MDSRGKLFSSLSLKFLFDFDKVKVLTNFSDFFLYNFDVLLFSKSRYSYNKTENYSVSMPSRDAFESIDEN